MSWSLVECRLHAAHAALCIDGSRQQTRLSTSAALPLPADPRVCQPLQEKAAEKVLVTDLQVVVENCLRGPASLLDLRVFADAKALTAMDNLQAKTRRLSDAPSDSTARHAAEARERWV